MAERHVRHVCIGRLIFNCWNRGRSIRETRDCIKRTQNVDLSFEYIRGYFARLADRWAR